MKISLIVCAYNTDKYIKKCFESIEKQTFDDYEVVVINDGSNDNTQIIIDEYVKKNNKFRTYYQNNSGQAVGRNKGIELARGDYVVFVDSDDEIEENYLNNLSEIIDKDVDFGYSRIRRKFGKKPTKLEKNFNYIHSSNINNKQSLSEKSVFTEIMNAPYAKIIRRKLLVDNDIVFAEGKLYEDFLFTQSILLNNPKIMSIDDDSYIYYVHEGTSMTGKGSRAFEMMDVFDMALDKVKEKGLDKELREEYEYLALYHIAIGTLYRSFMYKPYMFFNYLYKCREYLKRNNYTRHNRYVDGMSSFPRLFLLVFYSFL